MKNKQRDGGGDTEAILDRRRFLIESTLAGAGLGAVLAGCDNSSGPHACLSIEPQRRPKPKPPESQPCLSVEIGRPTTQRNPPGPGACLKVEVKPPRDVPHRPDPGPCLSPEPEWRRSLPRRPPKPKPGPCLSRSR